MIGVVGVWPVGVVVVCSFLRLLFGRGTTSRGFLVCSLIEWLYIGLGRHILANYALFALS